MIPAQILTHILEVEVRWLDHIERKSTPLKGDSDISCILKGEEDEVAMLSGGESDAGTTCRRREMRGWGVDEGVALTADLHETGGTVAWGRGGERGGEEEMRGERRREIER